MTRDTSPEFLKRLAGYGLTLAEITYGLPDYPDLVQIFTWQEYDVYPQMPVLRHFLMFWEREIEGPIRHVRFEHERLIKPQELMLIGSEYMLH